MQRDLDERAVRRGERGLERPDQRLRRRTSDPDRVPGSLAARLLGWTAGELAARPYHELVHPEDLERVKAAGHRVLQGRAGDRPETELRLRARDGSYRWFVFSTSYAPPDRLVYFSGKDITARKDGEEELRAAEERFRAITGSTRDGIVSADGTGRIIFRNAGAVDIFGWTEDQALGRPLTDLMPERYRDVHRAGVARFLATGEARIIGSTVELEGLRADGTEFPLELSLGTWHQGGAVCFSAVVRDLTDRVRARRALRERRSASPARSRAPPSACSSRCPTARSCGRTARCAS